MINYSKGKLTGTILVNSAELFVDLTTDKDCTYQAVLELSDGSVISSIFTNVNQRYRAKLRITADILNLLNNVHFYLVAINEGLSEKSNRLPVDCDMLKIKQSIKLATSKEVEELQKQVSSLKKTVESLTSSKIISGVNISNKQYIQPGMILIAIDNKGNFVAGYPFTDHVQKVNGQTPIDGLVNIDSSMINYKGQRTVEEAFNAQAAALSALNESLNTISETQKQIASRLANIEIEFETFKNNGIV